MWWVFVMGKLAFTHHGRSSVLPPGDLLEPHIERTDNHWYWLGEFIEDAFDRCAYFDWAAPYEKSTRWMVPRLLWQLAHSDVNVMKLVLENKCGLFTCINPQHLAQRNLVVPNPARIVLPEQVEAQPVVYIGNVLRTHIRCDGFERTMCGRVKMCTVLDKTAPITCDACIAAWIKAGHLYTEVK